MNIVFIAPGSRGDIQPYAALGKGLKMAGHHVRIISNMDHDSLVSSHGLSFFPIELDLQDYIQSEKISRVLENGGLISSMVEFSKGMKHRAALVADRVMAGSQDMDLIIVGISGLFIGLAVAEKTGLPLLQAYNLPITPTRAFPGVLAPQFASLFGGRLIPLSHQITRQFLWQTYRPTDTLVRRNYLDLPISPMLDPYKHSKLQQLPILYGFSPSVIPHPADWGNDIHITGFWNLDPVEGWTPPDELQRFLESDPKPIYIGFGSMSSRDPHAAADLVFKTLDHTGQRAVVLSGWGGLEKSDVPSSVMMLDSLPHSWLFQQVQAVVHHGGAGTTAAGMRAGVPSLIIPHHGDQPFWGHLTASLGVGPDPIPRRKLSSDTLAASIDRMVNDQEMKQKSSDLGKKIRNEDGIGEAVKILHHIEREFL